MDIPKQRRAFHQLAVDNKVSIAWIVKSVRENDAVRILVQVAKYQLLSGDDRELPPLVCVADLRKGRHDLSASFTEPGGSDTSGSQKRRYTPLAEAADVSRGTRAQLVADSAASAPSHSHSASTESTDIRSKRSRSKMRAVLSSNTADVDYSDLLDPFPASHRHGHDKHPSFSPESQAQKNTAAKEKVTNIRLRTYARRPHFTIEETEHQGIDDILLSNDITETLREIVSGMRKKKLAADLFNSRVKAPWNPNEARDKTMKLFDSNFMDNVPQSIVRKLNSPYEPNFALPVFVTEKIQTPDSVSRICRLPYPKAVARRMTPGIVRNYAQVSMKMGDISVMVPVETPEQREWLETAIQERLYMSSKGETKGLPMPVSDRHKGMLEHFGRELNVSGMLVFDLTPREVELIEWFRGPVFRTEIVNVELKVPVPSMDLTGSTEEMEDLKKALKSRTTERMWKEVEERFHWEGTAPTPSSEVPGMMQAAKQQKLKRKGLDRLMPPQMYSQEEASTSSASVQTAFKVMNIDDTPQRTLSRSKSKKKKDKGKEKAKPDTSGEAAEEKLEEKLDEKAKDVPMMSIVVPARTLVWNEGLGMLTGPTSREPFNLERFLSGM